ncbi:MAG: Ribonucleoside-diphosphate reductase NrdZ [bacterium ADurb.Bin400]|nr:MAG: Ribonucleoside-diphosphate reductase NrdZ [bacterium ADurb.Bin400]
MGFQDALYQLGVNFDSEKAVDLADQSQEIIAYYAYLASSELAAERGTYESYRGSKWDRGILPQDTLDLLEQERGEKIEVSRIERLEWGKIRESIQKNGMRNSNCLAIAPTATISNIAGCVPTIEPIYKNIYVKANVSGDFIIINPYMADELKRLGLWDERMLGKVKYYDGSIRQIEEIPVGVRERYKEVFEIDPKWLIKAAAYRGKWIDQSQSLNIYFIGSSGAQLSEVYFYAWSLGLKTTYYLRTLAKSQVEKSTVDTSQYGLTHKREAASKQLLTEQSGAAVRVETGPAEMKFCRLDDPTCESCQ